MGHLADFFHIHLLIFQIDMENMDNAVLNLLRFQHNNFGLLLDPAVRLWWPWRLAVFIVNIEPQPAPFLHYVRLFAQFSTICVQALFCCFCCRNCISCCQLFGYEIHWNPRIWPIGLEKHNGSYDSYWDISPNFSNFCCAWDYNDEETFGTGPSSNNRHM